MVTENPNITHILNELNKAVKMHNFYPSGHPHFDTAISDCFHIVKRYLDENERLKLAVDQNGFFTDGDPVAEGSGQLSELARKFFLRRIKELSIARSVTEEDIKNLVFILRIEPEELLASGGIERVFAEKGVEGILLNEMRYEDLKKLKAKIAEERQEEEEEEGAQEQEQEQGAKEVSLDETMAAELHPPPEEAAGGSESLDRMLEKIKTERDLLRYNDLAVRIREKGASLILREAFDALFPAVMLFHEHSQPGSGMPEDHRAISEEQLQVLLNNDGVLRDLAIRSANKEDPLHEEIKNCLVKGGERAIEILLEEAVAAPEAGVRRSLFNTLIIFGDKIIPYVEGRLQSTEWYVVRQMVGLVGELRNPEHITLLESTYDYDDIRVKKEVLKNLARIPSPEASAFLLKVLGEEEETLVTQAMVSLSVLKERSAVEGIGNIALKWEPFADRHELQKEAIKALGVIGDASAVEYLTKILFRKSWFGKKANQELKRLAASSLGMIGSPEAYSAIEKVLENSEGELYNTCKRIIDRREKDL